MIILSPPLIARTPPDVLGYIRQLEAAAYTDTLTGLGNRAAFERDIAALWQGGEPFALIALDADDLKGTNDRHGHAAGDALLCAIGGACRQGATRQRDAAYRLHGDEFAVLVSSGAGDAAERIRARLVESAAPASMGIAHATEADSTAALVALADARLYANKRGKRL